MYSVRESEKSPTAVWNPATLAASSPPPSMAMFVLPAAGIVISAERLIAYSPALGMVKEGCGTVVHAPAGEMVWGGVEYSATTPDPPTNSHLYADVLPAL